MGTPAKRRKLNNSTKTSQTPPAPPRNLDFFFGKQNQDLPSRSANETVKDEATLKQSGLTDEQLARKLQEEWDREDAGEGVSGSQTPALDQNLALETEPRNHNSREAYESGDINTGVDAPLPQKLEPTVNHIPAVPKNKTTLSLQSAGSAEDIITSTIPFDESPLTFEPSKYVPELQSHWAADKGEASYAVLTRCFVLVNSTQSRIKIVDTLVNMLRVLIEGDPSSLLPTVCF